MSHNYPIILTVPLLPQMTILRQISVRLIRLHSIDSAIIQSIKPIECRQSIERNRILPRKRLFDCDSIAFDNQIAIIRSRSIGSIAIFVRSRSIDIVWSYRSFIDHIDLLSIILIFYRFSKDRALISMDLNL